MISEYYNQFLECLRQRNFERAAGYMHLLNMNINFHLSTMRQLRAHGLTQREYARFLDIYVREFSDDPSGYLMLMGFYYPKGQLDAVRKIWKDTCANAIKGFHFQPPIIADIFEAEQGKLHTAVASLGMGTKLSAGLNRLSTLGAFHTVAPDLAPQPSGKDVAPARQVSTEPGEPIGIDAVALNGRLGGFTIPTVYYFRYGTDRGNLALESPVRQMPAGLFGQVRDGGANLFHRIGTNAAAVVFSEIPPSEEDDGGLVRESQIPSFAMKLEWPFGKDRNHRDGIGVIDLLLGWTSGAHVRDRVDNMEAAKTYPTKSFPGEGIDLRDAVLSVSYRSQALNSKAFSPVVWIHGRTGTAAFPDQQDDLAAWAVTGDDEPKIFIADGNWHKLDFEMPGQSSRWTFCGSNTEEMGSGMERYTYAPIQQMQRRNTGGNVCLAFVHGDELDTPEGSIEIAELALVYRSRSLLGLGQQAVLHDITGAQLCDPANLTDGSIGDLEKCWSAVVSPEKPCELIWQLRETADLEAFKIYQSVLAPAKDIEIAVSQDGTAYNDVWIGTMGDAPEDSAAWAAFASTGALCRIAVLAGKTPARYIRLRVISGHRHEQAGLDAFEVFGEGLPFVPSPENFTLSEDIGDLPMGEPLFAQLVAENADGAFEGEIVKVNRPQSEIPQILSVSASADGNGTATISARTIAMGTPATLTLRLESDQGGKITVPPLSIGKWLVPHDVRVKVEGLEASVSYKGVCQASNESGLSQPYIFSCGACE